MKTVSERENKMRLNQVRNFNGMVFVMLAVMIFTFSNTAWCSEIIDNTKARERGEPAQSSIKTRDDSGYCSQTGGSTSYESIQSANLELLPGGKTMRLTVGVYIANPYGCIAGKPCKTYDSSPEYVNAWIDWNGNKIFEENERVMNEAGTGYQNINYSGTMTFVKHFNVPSDHVMNTLMRINLGWGHDPNGSCEYSWEYGNSLDKEVKLFGIKDIKITPDAQVTGKDVFFTTEVNEVDGFGNLKVKWELVYPDNKPHISTKAVKAVLQDGTSEWSFEPPVGNYGVCTIKATLAYNGISISKTFDKDFNLYFEKDGDDDGDNIPNWFTYWQKDKAVPNIEYAYYDGIKSGFGYYQSGVIALCKIAANYRPKKTYNFNGNKDFYDTDGIDTAAQVVAHELNHQNIAEKRLPGGVWDPKNNVNLNSDFRAKGQGDKRNYDDSLPDFYENTIGTDPNKTDTFNLATQKGADYKYYGDNEYTSIIAGSLSLGILGNDWSDSGKIATTTGGTQKKSSREHSGSEPDVSPYSSGRGGSLMMPNSAIFGVSQKMLRDEKPLLTNVYSENITDKY